MYSEEFFYLLMILSFKRGYDDYLFARIRRDQDLNLDTLAGQAHQVFSRLTHKNQGSYQLLVLILCNTGLCDRGVREMA